MCFASTIIFESKKHTGKVIGSWVRFRQSFGGSYAEIAEAQHTETFFSSSIFVNMRIRICASEF
jgi:hypothetical protein